MSTTIPDDQPPRRRTPRIAAHHLEMLADSGISNEFARLRGYRTIRESESELLQKLGFSDLAAGCVPGLAVPLLDLHGNRWGLQYRPDNPYQLNGKTAKYITPVGQRNGIDVPPGVGDQLGDPDVWLWITEGTKKADCAAARGLCTVALSGVWNWRHTNKSGGKVALGDWDSIALNDGRIVVIAFDSDMRLNRQVHLAATRLANFLQSRGARVKYLHLPDGDWWDDDSKTGLDDFLVDGNTIDDLLCLVHDYPPDLFSDLENDDPTEPIESDVEHEVRRQNTFEEARRRRQARGWSAPPDQGSLRHQLKTVDTTTVYVVEDLFPDTAICQLSAQYKIGKTTLVTNLMHSLATGEPFLRRFRVKFAGNIAHWNMEVSQNTLLGWYRKHGMPEEALERCFPLSVRGNLSLDFNNETVVQWAIAWLQDNNIQAWIIDPLSKLYRDDENSSTAFNQWWLRLEHIAREAGLKLVMVVHHTGHANDRSRGTSAMMGNPDVLLSYTHSGNLGDNPPNNLRYLTALGRDVDVPSTEIGWEPETNTLFCTNSGTTRVQAKSTVRAREAGVVVWNANTRLKTGDLYKLLKWRQDGRTATENAKAIERAVAKGYITQEREGRTVWNARGSVDPRAGQDGPK